MIATNRAMANIKAPRIFSSSANYVSCSSLDFNKRHCNVFSNNIFILHNGNSILSPYQNHKFIATLFLIYFFAFCVHQKCQFDFLLLRAFHFIHSYVWRPTDARIRYRVMLKSVNYYAFAYPFIYRQLVSLEYWVSISDNFCWMK